MRGCRLWWGAALGFLAAAAVPAAAGGESFFAPRVKEAPAAAGEAGRRSPEIRLDERGHKTLVIHDQAPVPAPPSTPPSDAPPEKPYWLAGPRPEPERPYFLAEPKGDDRPPYWLLKEGEPKGEAPYWLARELPPERPYWEIPPRRVKIVSPPPSAAAAAPETPGDQRTISFFMFQDEAGVKHLTNIPDDPRYREFTFTVSVRLQRGLAASPGGRRLRFTHESLRPIIMRAALTYNLDPALIAAVIKSESAFDARAVSWAGARGLMQLMPATAREMGCADPFDPIQNIMAGSRYLRRMLDTFGGDLTLAVASYNCGPERVKRRWRVPDIAETRNYVVIVARNYERYKGQF